MAFGISLDTTLDAFAPAVSIAADAAETSQDLGLVDGGGVDPSTSTSLADLVSGSSSDPTTDDPTTDDPLVPSWLLPAIVVIAFLAALGSVVDIGAQLGGNGS